MFPQTDPWTVAYSVLLGFLSGLTCHRCPLSAWLRTTLHQCGAAPDPGGSSWPARDVYLTCLKTHTSYFVSPDQPTCYQAPFVPFLDHFLAIIPLPSHVIVARLARCNLRRWIKKFWSWIMSWWNLWWSGGTGKSKGSISPSDSSRLILTRYWLYQRTIGSLCDGRLEGEEEKENWFLALELPLGARYVRGMLLTRAGLVRRTIADIYISISMRTFGHRKYKSRGEDGNK